MDDIAVVDFTDKINGDLWLVLDFLLLKMRMLKGRSDSFVVLLLQFLQNWSYVANDFEYG